MKRFRGILAFVLFAISILLALPATLVMLLATWAWPTADPQPVPEFVRLTAAEVAERVAAGARGSGSGEGHRARARAN